MNDDYDDGLRLCPRCDGDGELMIAPEGFAIFDGDEVMCPVCFGEGYVSVERWAAYHKGRQEMGKILADALSENRTGEGHE
jgi:DnaJ-class molecular chaperone